MDVGFITFLRADLGCNGGVKSLCCELNVLFSQFVLAQSGECLEALSMTELYFSRACYPLAPTFSSWVTKKSYFFCTNHMLGTLDFTVSEHWASLNFP